VSRNLVFIFLLAAAAPSSAQTIYQCRQDGVLVFQDRACGADQVVREIEPAPAGDVAPGIADMVADWQARADARRGVPPKPRSRARGARTAKRTSPESHRCTAASGAVFYRHGACPARIATTGATRGKIVPAAETVADEPIPRSVACNEILRAGASVRSGHEHDERTDTYEHNLGRDPCL